MDRSPSREDGTPLRNERETGYAPIGNMYSDETPSVYMLPKSGVPGAERLIGKRCGDCVGVCASPILCSRGGERGISAPLSPT